MTDPTLAAIRQRHEQEGRWCKRCKELWPCDAITLLDRLVVVEKELKTALDFNDKAICGYCGYVGPRDIEKIADHMNTCENHPTKLLVEARATLTASEKINAQLEAELERVRVKWSRWLQNISHGQGG